jgi:hypothetical protein
MHTIPNLRGDPGSGDQWNLRIGLPDGKACTGQFCRFGSRAEQERGSRDKAASLDYLPLAIFFWAIIFRVNRSPSTIS